VLVVNDATDLAIAEQKVPKDLEDVASTISRCVHVSNFLIPELFPRIPFQLFRGSIMQCNHQSSCHTATLHKKWFPQHVVISSVKLSGLLEAL